MSRQHAAPNPDRDILGTIRHIAVRRSDQLTTYHHGEADHLAWLERPFAETLRTLDERGRT